MNFIKIFKFLKFFRISKLHIFLALVAMFYLHQQGILSKEDIGTAINTSKEFAFFVFSLFS